MFIRQITYAEAKKVILQNHYSRTMPCVQYAFGLFEGGLLVGVVTYGQPASPWLCKGICGEENRKFIIELNRLVIMTNTQNSGSFLVGRSLRLLPKPICVVSYADCAWGHIGAIYQACNFIYTGCTKARTDMASEGGRHSRHNKGDSSKRQVRSAKHRYVYFAEKNGKLRQALAYNILPYPKGDSYRYDTNSPEKPLILDI
jgi:hypothetical protein